MASVTIQGVKKNFGEVPILHGVDIDPRCAQIAQLDARIQKAAEKHLGDALARHGPWRAL